MNDENGPEISAVKTADAHGATARAQTTSIETRAGPVFWAALAVGMCLTLGGALALSQSWIGQTPALLVLCSGLGIVLGAFGSTATINYKGIVIAGVAAVAITLLLLVDHLIRDDFVELELAGDVRDASNIEVYGDRNYPGAANAATNRYDFIIIGREIKHQTLGITVNFAPVEPGNEEETHEFECIPRAEVEPYLGSGRLLEWRFDRKRRQILDNTHVIAETGPCPDKTQTFSKATTPWLSAVIREAFAGEDVGALIQDLESGSSSTRRAAREALAAIGPSTVRPLLDQLAVSSPTYRTRLGVVVALTEMLRANKPQRKEIAALLTDDDLRRLADAAGDPDRTVRIYASEFLFDLGDPRAVPVAFERIPSANDDGRYNLLLVVKGAYQELSEDERATIDQKLESTRELVGKQTNALIDEILLLPARSPVSFAALKEEYVTMYQEARVPADAASVVDSYVGRLLENRERYEQVTKPLGIPWYFLGIIHALDSDFNFDGHIYNGDPLSDRTIHVPVGRPLQGKPPFAWEDSARDFVEYRGLIDWKEWTIAGMLYQWEKFNGFGYRKREVPSPYLWNYTDRYTKGAFGADGKYDPDQTPRAPGAAAILLRLIETGKIDAVSER